MSELIVALRSEADLSEKGLDFMDDADLAEETRVQIGMLRDAADVIEEQDREIVRLQSLVEEHARPRP